MKSNRTMLVAIAMGVVFASTMSVLQDLGYIVNSADLDAGLITTESPATSDRATFLARFAIFRT